MIVADAIRSVIETFVDGFEHFKKDEDPDFTCPRGWVSLVAFVFVFLLVSLFGKMLWNMVLAGAGSGKGFITVLKPLPTLTDAIVMFFALSLFFP